jgi:hypothetical protein
MSFYHSKTHPYSKCIKDVKGINLKWYYHEFCYELFSSRSWPTTIGIIHKLAIIWTRSNKNWIILWMESVVEDIWKKLPNEMATVSWLWEKRLLNFIWKNCLQICRNDRDMRNVNNYRKIFETINRYKFRWGMGNGKRRDIAIFAQEKNDGK